MGLAKKNWHLDVWGNQVSINGVLTVIRYSDYGPSIVMWIVPYSNFISIWVKDMKKWVFQRVFSVCYSDPLCICQSKDYLAQAFASVCCQAIQEFDLKVCTSAQCLRKWEIHFKTYYKGPLHGRQGITQLTIALLLYRGESYTLSPRFASIGLYDRNAMLSTLDKPLM